MTAKRPLVSTEVGLVASLIVGLLLISIFLVRGPVRALGHSGDFGLYYSSAVAMLDGSDPYAPQNLRAIAEARGVPTHVIENAIAPPAVFLPLLPYALLPWTGARLLWLITNLIAVGGLVGMVGAWAWRFGRAEVGWAAVSGMLVLGLAPLQTCIAFGQLSVASVACLAAAVYLDQKQRPHLALVLYLLGSLLKPQLGISLALYWVYRRRWGILVLSVAGGAAANALSMGWLWWSEPAWYGSWRSNMERLFNGGVCDFARASGGYIFANLQFPLYQFFADKSVTNAVAYGLATVLLLLALTPAWKRYRILPAQRCPETELLVASFLGVWGLLAVYHVYYDAAIVVLPLAWALAWLHRCPTLGRGTLVGVLYLGFALPWGPLFNQLAVREYMPVRVSEHWLYQGIPMAMMPWMILAVSVGCVAALYRGKECVAVPPVRSEGDSKTSVIHPEQPS